MKLLIKLVSTLLVSFLLLGIFLGFTNQGLKLGLRLASIKLPGSLKVASVKGHLLGDIHLKHINYQVDDFNLKATSLVLQLDSNKLLQAQVVFKQAAVENVEIAFENKPLLSAGQLHLSGSLEQFNYQVNAMVVEERLPQSPLLIEGVGNSKTIKIMKAQLGEKELLLQFRGEINLNPQLNFSLTYKGHYQQVSFKGESSGNFSNAQLHAQTLIDAHGKLLGQALKAKAVLSLDEQSHADIQLGDNHLNLSGKLSLPLKINLNIPSLESLGPYAPNIHSSLNLKGVIAPKGDALITLSKGYYLLEDGQRIDFQGGKLQLNYRNQTLLINGHIALHQGQQVSLKAAMPLKSFDINKQKISGEAKLKLTDLSFLDKLIDETQHTHGEINATASFEGSLLSPHIKTHGQLTQGATTVTNLNLKLQNINLEFKGTENQWEVAGSLTSGGGSLSVSGSAHLSKEHFKSHLNIKGQGVQVVNTRQYKAVVDPNLELISDNSQLQLKGDILVTEATLSPDDFTSSHELPDDVEIVGETSTGTDSSLSWAFDLAITLGDKVQLAVEGLTGKLAGKVKVSSAPQQVTRANGKLTVSDGQYNAHGQKLKLTKGELSFNGGALDNPSLSLIAQRTFVLQSVYTRPNQQSLSSTNTYFDDFSNQIIVGIQVTGRLKQPKTTLFSNQGSFSQADMLSMLLIGKPAAAASSSQGALLLGALSSLNLGGGTSGQQLTGQLQHALGLDDLSLETQSQYNADTHSSSENTALVLSKSLSSRLSLSYSIGFLQASNILRIIYKLNRAWSIQTEASVEASGMDIFYTVHKQ